MNFIVHRSGKLNGGFNSDSCFLMAL